MRADLGRAISAAWQRTRTLLLAPFSLERWIVVGFAAWLANLASGPGHGGASWAGNGDGDGESVGEAAGGIADGILEALDAVTGWELWVLGLAAFGLAVALAIGVVLLWVSSRAQFVFLENVVRSEAAIAEPWKRWGALGDSLFLFRLAFAAVVLAGAVGLVALFVTSAAAVEEPVVLVLWIPLILFLALLLLAIDVVLRHFVVPVMMARRQRVLAAWGSMEPLLRRHAPTFLLYLVALLIVWLVVGALVTAVGIMTCCLGFLLLMIPYVGTVLLLPVHVFLRALGPEILRQLDPRLDLWPGAAPPPPPVSAP